MKATTFLSVFFLQVVSSYLAIGQVAPSSIIGNKIIKSVFRKIGNFKVVKVSMGINLQMNDSLSGDKLSISGDSNVIGQVVSQVQNDTLVLTLSKKYLLRDISTIHVTAQPNQIHSIIADTGSFVIFSKIYTIKEMYLKADHGSKISIPISCEHIKISANNNSIIEISGNVQTSNINLDRRSRIIGNNLKLKESSINLDNGSEATVDIDRVSSMNLLGMSTLKFYGNPSILKQNITEMSKVEMLSR